LAAQLAGLYHAGRFTPEDVASVGRLLSMWCVALPFYASYMFIYRVFTARRKLWRFIIIDGIGRLLLVTLYGFLTTGFGLWSGIGLIGVPLADTIVYALLCGVILYVLRTEIGSFGLSRIVVDGAKTLLAACIAIAPPLALIQGGILDKMLGGQSQGPLISLVIIAIIGLFSLTVFYFLSKLFKIPEIATVDSLLARVKGLFKRQKCA